MRINLGWGKQALAAAAAVGITVPAISLSNEKKEVFPYRKSFEEKEQLAIQAVQGYMAQKGIPGLSVAVSIDGQIVWSRGFGFADVETLAPVAPSTVMRIASISKSLTSTAAMLLVEQKKLDLSAPIQTYLPDFPQKEVDKKKVAISTRQLLSHRSGIRHYYKKDEKEDESPGSPKEFYSNISYKSVSDALEIFQNDELLAEPGTKMIYTTHGFTVISAILEKASGEKFEVLMKDLFRKLGMSNTFFDTKNKIINGRSKYYIRTSSGELENCPEVDNSCKWAGGGMLSTVEDLLRFAHALLFSHQAPTGSAIPPLISKETLTDFWKGEGPYGSSKYSMACLGWFRSVESAPVGGVKSLGGYWYHTGAAVGASSSLLIKPSSFPSDSTAPRGVCVAIICNLQHTCVHRLSEELCSIFGE